MALAQLSIDIEARLASYEQQMAKVAQVAEGAAGRMKSAFSNVGAILGASMGALAAAGAVGKFKELVDYLDAFDESAERIGTTAENLSALAYAAKLNGVEFDELNKGLVKFSGTLADAASGNKEAIALLDRLGVSAKNYQDLDAALNQVADRFATLEAGVGKTALASEAFGDKLGSKMVPLLNQGAAGMAALRKEAEALGAVVDTKLAADAAKLNDNLDRLATLSSVVGKTIASDLLPSLNDTATAFIEAMKRGERFEAFIRGFAGIGKVPFDLFFGDSAPDVSYKAHLSDLRNELATLENKLRDGANGGLLGKIVYGDPAELNQRMLVIRNQIAALEKFGDPLERLQEKAAQPKPGGSGIVPASGKPRKTRDTNGSFTDYEAILTERIAKAINDTDLLKAQELEASLAKLDTLAAAGLDPAIVKAVRDDLSGAAKKAADEAERLNKLLAGTDSSKLEESRADMQLLAAALEKGAIAEEKYLEAVNKRLNEGNDVIKEQKSLVEDLGLTFSSAFEDAVVGGKNLQDVLKALLQDIAKVILRKNVTEPLLNSAKGFDWASIGSSIASFFTANADGGVYRSPSLSAYSGKVYDSPQFFAFASGAGVFAEAGPEAIMPLRRGRDGKLGVVASGGGGDVSIVQQFYISGNGAQQETTASGGDNAAVKQFSERMAGVAKMVIVQEMRPGGMLQGVRA